MVARSMRPWEMTRDLVRTGQRVLGVRRVRVGPGHRPGPGKAALPLSAPRTSFNSALTRRRNVALGSIGLDDVKALKRATGTTVNDVVLAVCTGALRSYLLDGDELPDKPLVAVVPISVRPDIDSPRGSNQVSAMFVQLPVHLDDPVERLMAVHEGTEGAKEEHNALGRRHAAELGRARHAQRVRQRRPVLLEDAAGQRAPAHRQPGHLQRARDPTSPSTWPGPSWRPGFPLGPVMDGMGVNITVMSYRGVLYWGIIACPETVPMVWDLADAVPAALDELLAAVGLDPSTDPSGVTPRHGDGATAIDEAPPHTGIGAPKVWGRGGVGDHRVEAVDQEGAGRVPGRPRCRSGAGCRSTSAWRCSAGAAGPGSGGSVKRAQRGPGSPNCWPRRPPGGSVPSDGSSRPAPPGRRCRIGRSRWPSRVVPVDAAMGRTRPPKSLPP